MVALLKQPLADLVNRPKPAARAPLAADGPDASFAIREDFIKSTPLFAELATGHQQAITRWMQPEIYHHNQTLFERGNWSDALYLVEQGWVKLHADDSGSTVANYGPGSLFGEVDFLLGRPRAATARADGNVTAWTLDDSALTQIIAHHPEIGLNLGLALGAGIAQFQEPLARWLAQIPLLQQLGGQERFALARRLSPHHYLPRETVYRSGDPATGIFFIQHGGIWLLGNNDEDYTELGAGDFFGERAVISGTPHARTAQAATEVVIWQLSPADFASLVVAFPAIKRSLSQNLQYNLNEALTIASLIVDGEINALNIVCGAQNTLVKKLNRVNRMLTWLKNHNALL